MTYILDTHPLYWHLVDSPKLSEVARQAIEDRSAGIVIPTIVWAELKHLEGRGKITISVDTWLREMVARNAFVVHPFDEDVLRWFPQGLEIHDSIIVATALFYQDQSADPVKVVTKDQQIIGSQLIQTTW